MKQRFGKSALLAGAAVFFCVASPGDVQAQATAKSANIDKAAAEVRSSAAYAELLLKKTEVQAEVEGLAMEYTEEFPKLVEARYALEVIEKERLRLLSVKSAAASKLTIALGKLMVRKIEHEVELWTLRKSLQDAHPDVKRAKRKVDIYESAIKEILG